MNSAALNVLILEDHRADAELMSYELESADLKINWRRVEDEASYDEALTDGPDILLADYHLPGYGAVAALKLLKRRCLQIPFILVSGTIGEERAVEMIKLGATDYVLKDRIGRLGPAVKRALEEAELREAESEAQEALRRSEARRIKMQTELSCAARVQSRFLPDTCPPLDGFELAARCLPAHQVGGDFYDWQAPSPGVVSLTLGDVMGNGLSAAMLMATVRATLRALSQKHSPAHTVHLAQRALWEDLEGSESFVTLFHARLDLAANRLTYVDCGHGFEFLRRADGSIENLEQRGLPLGVKQGEMYREGAIGLEPGDLLLVHSDGLHEIRPELKDPRQIAASIAGASAHQIVDRLCAMPEPAEPPPDDLTVLTLCRK